MRLEIPAPANTFLKQERLQLAEASCEKLSGYIEIIELPIPNFQTLVVIVVPHITHISGCIATSRWELSPSAKKPEQITSGKLFVANG